MSRQTEDSSFRRMSPSVFRAMLWLAALAFAAPVAAVPSYARQTGQACAACHVGGFGPQLTAFGREFKLRGYTLSADDIKRLPISAMLVGSQTHTRQDQSGDAGPHDGPNDNASLQQLSLFVAGKLAPHLGVFAQATYSDIDRHVAIDNVELRYARDFQRGGHSGVWGVAVNNNPGLSDLHHSQAAWRFPFIASELAPAPSAAVLADGGLGQQVIGADAYVSLDERWYLSLGLYHTLSAALLADLNADFGGRTTSPAMYWRVSRQFAAGGGSLAIGASGLAARIAPDGGSSLSNRYDDVGGDVEYERPFGSGDLFTMTGTYTHERQRLNASFDAGESDRIGHSLDSATLNASLTFHDHFGLTLGVFDLRGTGDTLLFAPDPDAGSANGKPDSRGEILQADWTPFGTPDSWRQPWLNARIGVQYTHYDRFNGGTTNYDGFGRAAGDNDTLFVFVWTAI